MSRCLGNRCSQREESLMTLFFQPGSTVGTPPFGFVSQNDYFPSCSFVSQNELTATRLKRQWVQSASCGQLGSIRKTPSPRRAVGSFRKMTAFAGRGFAFSNGLTATRHWVRSVACRQLGSIRKTLNLRVVMGLLRKDAISSPRQWLRSVKYPVSSPSY
jgi:hypothetical protein